MTMGPFGLEYERTQTWWEQSRPWHEYLARCQALLQRGLFVADACYLTTESAFAQLPSKEQLRPALPLGYNYDLAAPEAMMRRASVKDGRLVFPDGMSYQLLVLPPGQTMTVPLLTKLKELVIAGATLVGRPRPTLRASPGFRTAMRK